MDRYMNDTHSLYYNVDHSSMYGSNLSTVFADGPPPLEEEHDDDHGEFVFSSETNAIGEAVLTKIESKLQRDAEEKSLGEHERANFGLGSETKANSSTEKFEAFADFENSNQFINSSGQDAIVESSQEVNGYGGSMTSNASEDEFSGEEFGDFSSGFVEESQANGDNCGSLTNNESKLNNKSMFDNFQHVSYNGMEGTDTKTESDSNDFEFANFSNLDGEINKVDDNHEKCPDNNAMKKPFMNNDEARGGNENSDASDEEFGSFTDIVGDVHNKPQSDNIQINGHINVVNHNPDVIPATENFSHAKLSNDLTNNEPKHNDDEFQSFEAFNDNSYNDFTGTSAEDFGNFSKGFSTTGNKPEGETPDNIKSQDSKTDISRPDTKLESKSQTQRDIAASHYDDDFADFADFSNNSFSAFSSESGNTSETGSSQWGDFGAFTDNSQKNVTQEMESRKTLSGNNSNCSRQNSDDFTAFSESASSKIKQGFQADFGALSQKNVSNKLFKQTSSTKQVTTQLQLVSLHGCFQHGFVTLACRLEDLWHVKVPGKKRINQENLWKNLCSNQGEGALRYSWEECKTSNLMCKALDVSRKNIVVNPSILAMSEGLEIPVFAAGLGILQPSIVPTPAKKKRTKSKQSKEVTTETPSQSSLSEKTSSSSLQQQLAISEVKTESIKDSNSDSASLSDTASLDLDFFASTPSNLQGNSDQSSSSGLYNLDFAFGPAPPGNQAGLSQHEFEVFKVSKSARDDPLQILKKLDTTKMSSSVVNESQAQLSPRAMEIIATLDNLSFMHSSVLMFPLHKNN